MKLRRTKSRLQDSLHTLHTVCGSKAKIVCGIENDKRIPNTYLTDQEKGNKTFNALKGTIVPSSLAD